jgi:hypothetical protein
MLAISRLAVRAPDVRAIPAKISRAAAAARRRFPPRFDLATAASTPRPNGPAADRSLDDLPISATRTGRSARILESALVKAGFAPLPLP